MVANSPSGGNCSNVTGDAETFVDDGTCGPFVGTITDLNPNLADNPNDNGHGVLLSWEASPDDADLLVYEIWRGPAPDAPDSLWFQVGTAPRGETSWIYFDSDETLQGNPNPNYVAIGVPVHLKLRGRAGDGTTSAFTPAATGQGRGRLVP